MAVLARFSEGSFQISSSSAIEDDPLLPVLRSIHNAFSSSKYMELGELVSNCINSFKSNPRYQDDLRFLKIWFLYMDCSSDYEGIFKEMEKHRICMYKAQLYETFAIFLEAKGKFIDASLIYNLGISRAIRKIEESTGVVPRANVRNCNQWFPSEGTPELIVHNLFKPIRRDWISPSLTVTCQRSTKV